MYKESSMSVSAFRTGLFLLLLLAAVPMAAQYIRSTEGMVQDMSSTSFYLGRECPDNVTDTACYTVSRTSSDWTPIRNGYLITEVLAERPQGIGFGRNTSDGFRGGSVAGGLLRADFGSRLSVSLTPMAMSLGAVAVDPYQEERTEPEVLHSGGPRRVSPDSGYGEPGPLPVGDIPWGLMVGLIMSYGLGIRNRRRRREAN